MQYERKNLAEMGSVHREESGDTCGLYGLEGGMNKIMNRLKSFEKLWNKWVIDPLQLSRAGFYYTGVDDCIKCFSCKGVLEDWNITYEIWTEHAFWFPGCQHVKNIKGEEFIDNIQKKWIQDGVIHCKNNV